MGAWKLHVEGTPPLGFEGWNDDWVDPRRPNGTTILAQEEQAKPSQYPGMRTGDRSMKLALFNLESDPAEQHDVSAKNPEVVAKLQAKFAEMMQ